MTAPSTAVASVLTPEEEATFAFEILSDRIGDELVGIIQRIALLAYQRGMEQAEKALCFLCRQGVAYSGGFHRVPHTGGLTMNHRCEAAAIREAAGAAGGKG